MKGKRILLWMVLTLCTSPAMAANLVQNGGFEMPVATDPFITVQPAGNLGAWTVGGVNVDLLRASFFGTAEGNQSVDMSGDGPGSVSQALETVAGTSYTLRFALAGNPGDNPMVKELEVYWGDQLLDTATFDATGRTATDPGWKRVSYTVTATASKTMLRFVSLTPGNAGPLLDDVSVEALPVVAAATTPSAPYVAGPNPLAPVGESLSFALVAGSVLCVGIAGLLVGGVTVGWLLVSRRKHAPK